jgi:hypothetical protein
LSDIEPSRFDPIEPYQRAEGESREEYEAFVEYCRIPPSSRSYGNLVRRTGLPINFVQRAAKKNLWLERSGAFDKASEALRPDPASMDEEASRAAQLAAAAMLQELGSLAISMKNPAHVKVADALRLVDRGIEIQRRALGEADMTISVKHETMQRVDAMVDKILELEAEDVEVVDEYEDDGEDHEGVDADPLGEGLEAGGED